MKWVLKNIGLIALGMCILCASIECNRIYALYVRHEEKREENIHIAYSNVLNRVAAVQAVAVALPANVMAPPVTMQKISAAPKVKTHNRKS